MSLFKDVIHLFYPEICLSCDSHLNKNEKIICINCIHELPLTNFCNEENNLTEKVFQGRISIENASSYLFFKKKGIVQKLIHQLKYKNRQEIGTLIGFWIGAELKNSTRFKNLDCIIPVPIHSKKLKIRGYNQLTTFGKSISNVLEIPFIEDQLLKTVHTNTQTYKQRVERWVNVNQIFSIKNKSALENKHILLIDDVITTGATLEACTNELLKCNNTKVSIVSIAYAY